MHNIALLACACTHTRSIAPTLVQQLPLVCLRLFNRPPLPSSPSTHRPYCAIPPAAKHTPSGIAHTLERTFTHEDIAAFTSLTGDANPIHQQGATSIVPGLFLASLFPAIIGTKYPGARYLTQELRFRQPVLVGSTVVAHVELQRASGSRHQFVTRCMCEGNVAVEGVALALMTT